MHPLHASRAMHPSTAPGARSPALTPLYTHAPRPVRVPAARQVNIGPPVAEQQQQQHHQQGRGGVHGPGPRPPSPGRGGGAAAAAAAARTVGAAQESRNVARNVLDHPGPRSSVYDDEFGATAASRFARTGSSQFPDSFEDSQDLSRLVPLTSSLNPVTPTESTQSSVRRYSASPSPGRGGLSCSPSPGRGGGGPHSGQGAPVSRSGSTHSMHSMHGIHAGRGRGRSATRDHSLRDPSDMDPSPPPIAGSGLRLGPGGQSRSTYEAYVACTNAQGVRNSPGHSPGRHSPGRSPHHSPGRGGRASWSPPPTYSSGQYVPTSSSELLRNARGLASYSTHSLDSQLPLHGPHALNSQGEQFLSTRLAEITSSQSMHAASVATGGASSSSASAAAAAFAASGAANGGVGATAGSAAGSAHTNHAAPGHSSSWGGAPSGAPGETGNPQQGSGMVRLNLCQHFFHSACTLSHSSQIPGG